MPAGGAAVNWKFVDSEGEYCRADSRGAAASAAGDAHVAADAGAVVTAIDDEVVALRLQADGAVDRGRKQFVIGGGAPRLSQIRGGLLGQAGVARGRAGDAHPGAGVAGNMRPRRD